MGKGILFFIKKNQKCRFDTFSYYDTIRFVLIDKNFDWKKLLTNEIKWFYFIKISSTLVLQSKIKVL